MHHIVQHTVIIVSKGISTLLSYIKKVRNKPVYSPNQQKSFDHHLCRVVSSKKKKKKKEAKPDKRQCHYPPTHQATHTPLPSRLHCLPWTDHSLVHGEAQLELEVRPHDHHVHHRRTGAHFHLHHIHRATFLPQEKITVVEFIRSTCYRECVPAGCLIVSRITQSLYKEQSLHTARNRERCAELF